jgi:putative NADH-flavin reductase
LNTAGFTVTAIQRADSTNSAPTASKSIKVDLSSPSALTSAFRNQDVVVSAVPNPRLSTEKIWIEAAISAGVKRIIPSEYSTNLETALSRKLPIVQEKLEIREYVEGLGKEGKIEWTSINNGPFFVQWIWLSGFIGPDVKNKKATWHDGGEKIVATSTLERIGEGVARSLLDEYKDETRNKPIYVYSAAMSEKKMAGIVTRLSGIEFQGREASIEEITRKAFEDDKGDGSHDFNFYIPFCFGEGYGGDFRYLSWNEKLGLKEMSEGEVEGLVKGWLEEMGGEKVGAS